MAANLLHTALASIHPGNALLSTWKFSRMRVNADLTAEEKVPRCAPHRFGTLKECHLS